ncbi:ArnT family glycosyltransferase [Mariprofundus ferrooxydans]|uniref:ArnT family glycosyltransferase n=1 Tax=Mariprofundus ferrooxydans TaxID=314344 RepID=UPI00036F44FB|nr:glycosyltransferase family 39 protein [Mariprofundus ferrooxydans]
MSVDFSPSLRLYQTLTLLAAAFMLLPLPVMQYVGEEGLMAMKSYEMFVRHDWLHPSILGFIWPHSPLWHWPVIIISKIIGWEHVDIAVRLVSVMATWLSALCAGLMGRWLFSHSHAYAGWLSALVYLTLGEVAFWYGWLGYIDATFGMFIFAAIAALWRAVADEHAGWFIVSLLLISLAFMTKNITAYALFGAAGLVLVWRLQRWHLLKKPLFLITGLLALSVPVLWQHFIVPAGESTATTTINDVLRNYAGYGVMAFIGHWLSFPLVFLFRALPVSLFLTWLWLRRKQQFLTSDTITTMSLLLLICFLPFWISAGATPRYLVPLYGLVALLLTGLLLQLNREHLRQAVMLMALIVVIKVPYSLGILPYIKDWMPERDVKVVAEEIMHLTDDAPLYSRNDVATGLAIAAYIDVWRQDRPPITWYTGSNPDVYILAEVETPSLGRLVKMWPLRGDHVYLYRHTGKQSVTGAAQ